MTDVVTDNGAAKSVAETAIEPWRRRLLLTWVVLSLLWVGYMAKVGWDSYNWQYEVIEDVSIQTEVDSALYKSINKEKSDADKMWDALKCGSMFGETSIEKLEPGSAELTAARKCFPSFGDKSDATFSNHLRSLIRAEVAAIRSSRSWNVEQSLWWGATLGLIPPAIVLLPVLLIRKYLPNPKSPHTKKFIAISLIWMISVGAWALISEGGDFSDAFEAEYLLLSILPPIVLIVAAVLWKWANRTPGESGR
jgi:hypothetical protein